MSKPCRLADERACALQGKFTIHIQSNNGATMFAGLHALEGQEDFNAHLHHHGDYWCAMVATDSLDFMEPLSERLAGVGPEHHHWVRMMVWDEANQYIVFDRTYTPDGDMREPVPA